MLKIILFNIFIVLIIIGCDTEENLTQLNDQYFIKYYGGDGDQEGVDVLQLNDGGFILLGNSMNTGGRSNLFLVRTDSRGNEQWAKTFGGNQNAKAGGIAIDNAGNFVIGATIDEIAGGATDAMIFRVNEEGNKIDSALYGAQGKNEIINNIIVTSQQEIIIIGSTDNVDVNKADGSNATTDLLDIYSVKVNQDLVPISPNLWRQVYGFKGIDIGEQIIERVDGSFIFFGTTNRINSETQKEGFNMFLFPISITGFPNGNIELRYYGTLNNEYASQIIESLDGGYAMIGRSESANGQNSIYMSRIRSNFNLVSEQSLTSGADISGKSIVETASGFLILGEDNSTGSGSIYLSKVSTFNDQIFLNTFGGIDNDKSSRVIECNDGGIGIIGTIELESQTKMCLIKTNRDGKLKP